MKKVLKFVLMGLAVMLISLTTTSCNRPIPWFDDTHGVDSLDVVSQIEGIINPQFTSVDDLLRFHAQDVEGYAVDSVFRTMSETTIRNVGSVILKKATVVSKKAVVEEYRANRAVYDNLPTSPINNTAVNEVDLYSTDLGNRQEDEIIKTSVNYRHDTIDGKPIKVQVKTEERYVE